MDVDAIASATELRDPNENLNKGQLSEPEHTVDEQRSKIYVPPHTSVFKPVITSVPSWTIYDHVGDEKIREVFTSSELLKTTLGYACEGTNYKIFLLYNPEKLPLKDKSNYSTPISTPLIFCSDPTLPSFLKKHFEELYNLSSIHQTDVLFQDSYYPSYKLSSLEELNPVKYDRVGDGKIRKVFTSPEFVKTTLDYTCDETNYKIFLLYNPEKLPLKDKSNYYTQISKPLIIFSNRTLPLFLKKHFEELCNQHSIAQTDVLFQDSYYPSYKLSSLEELNPVKYDLVRDGKIREVFTSSEFVKTTLDYTCDGTNYKIFLLYNPEKLPLKGRSNYSTPISKPLIFCSDPTLPSFLKKHFEELYNLSSIHQTDVLFQDSYYPSYKLSLLEELNPVKEIPLADKALKIDQALKEREDVKPSLFKRIFNWTFGVDKDH